MNWYIEQVFGMMVVAVLSAAVVWEIGHLGAWLSFVSDDPANWLREHAYGYVGWIFGTHFGWVLG